MEECTCRSESGRLWQEYTIRNLFSLIQHDSKRHRLEHGRRYAQHRYDKGM